MTETITPARARRRRPHVTWPDVVLLCVGVAVSVLLMRHLEDPPRAAFTVRNDTAWALTLYVESGDDAVAPVVTIGAEEARRVTEVLVPGDTWRFVWRYSGENVGSSTVAHSDLLRAGFELRVPDEVENALRAQGARPTP